MPITIGGQEINAITVNGQSASRATVNGTVVWTSGPTIEEFLYSDAGVNNCVVSTAGVPSCDITTGTISSYDLRFQVVTSSDFSAIANQLTGLSTSTSFGSFSVDELVIAVLESGTSTALTSTDEFPNSSDGLDAVQIRFNSETTFLDNLPSSNDSDAENVDLLLVSSTGFMFIENAALILNVSTLDFVFQDSLEGSNLIGRGVIGDSISAYAVVNTSNVLTDIANITQYPAVQENTQRTFTVNVLVPAGYTNTGEMVSGTETATQTVPEQPVNGISGWVAGASTTTGAGTVSLSQRTISITPDPSTVADGVTYTATRVYVVTTTTTGGTTTTPYTCTITTPASGGGTNPTSCSADSNIGVTGAIGAMENTVVNNPDSVTEGPQITDTNFQATGTMVAANTAAWQRTDIGDNTGGTAGAESCPVYPATSPFGWSVVGATGATIVFSGTTPVSTATGDVAQEFATVTRSRICTTPITGGTRTDEYTCDRTGGTGGSPTCAANASLGLPLGNLGDEEDVTVTGISYTSSRTETENRSIDNTDYVPQSGAGSTTFEWVGTIPADGLSGDVTSRVRATGDAVLVSASLVGTVARNNSEDDRTVNITVGITYDVPDEFDNNGRDSMQFTFNNITQDGQAPEILATSGSFGVDRLDGFSASNRAQSTSITGISPTGARWNVGMPQGFTVSQTTGLGNLATLTFTYDGTTNIPIDGALVRLTGNGILDNLRLFGGVT